MFNDLLLKLENQGYGNIVYMVVNKQEERSQELHHLLQEKLLNVTLYAQAANETDVWQTVSAQKDDMLVYDRCGRLTHHISLPYTILSYPHVEEAIKHTYCDGICGECSAETSETLEECRKTTAAETEDHPHPHHHRHPHHHHRHHHHHHGQNSMERHQHDGIHHHHRHHHDGQQQVLVEVDFAQVANEPPVVKQP